MKKMLFGLIATVMFGFVGNAKQIIDETIIANKKIVIENKSNIDDLLKIKIHIEWGRKSKNCEGFGICSTDIDVEISDLGFRGIANEDGRLYLEMTSVGFESLNKNFGSNTIIIEEDFQMPDSVCKELGLKQGYTIKIGKYNVTKNKLGVYSVVL